MHKVFFIFLIFLVLSALFALSFHGLDYYTTPMDERPFLDEHDTMKPSGYYSHGLGILGSIMIIIGVITYSTRKRVRTLWKVGRLSNWLEFHIFLCLLGPILVVYHTTFKAGGIAAISLWCMLSVVASGVVGRFLYVLIPRNISGTELTTRQIDEELDRLGMVLRKHELGSQLLEKIDAYFMSIKRPEKIGEAIATYFRLDGLRRVVKRDIRKTIAATPIDARIVRPLYKAAATRVTLIQRSIILIQVEKLFYYWHVIHLPFTAIMFITLAVHVGVAIWMGYGWGFLPEK